MKKHQDEHISMCQNCGATVYREHLDSGIARYEGGRLLCSVCVSEYERSHDAAGTGKVEEFAPIEFEEDDTADLGDSQPMSSTRIHSVSAATLGLAGGWDDNRFKRRLRPELPGASRCRTFHCRLSDGAIDFMQNQINEWLDGNDQIVVKFVSANIGLFEGKHTEPNLILSVFY
jgi:hypothetical protein